MKLTKSSFLAAIAAALVGGEAAAQEYSSEPQSLQGVFQQYEYFTTQPPTEVSPSDRPPPVPKAPMPKPTPAPITPMAVPQPAVVAVPNCTSLGCTSPSCPPAGCVTPAFGPGCCDPSNFCCDNGCAPWTLFPKTCRGWQMTGWLDAGGLALEDSAPSRFAGPHNWVYREDFVLNQAYATLGKVADNGGCGTAFGGRVDAFFGTDFRFAQARGLELNPDGSDGWNNHRFYGLALPQAYGEVALNDLRVKAGHFYSIVGYESTMAPQNFFYTKSYHFQYCSPFTLTGALADWKANDELTLIGGLHNGWDNFDPVRDRTGFVGGANYAPVDRDWTLSFALITGDEPDAVGGLSNRTNYSLIWNWNINCCWQYVFEHRWASQVNGLITGARSEWYGINQYLFRKIDDCWKAGARFEWFRDDDGTRVSGSPALGNPNQGSFAGNFFEVSAGLNWTPRSNLIIRPEVRWDWYDGAGSPFNDLSRDHQLLAAFDVILLW